MEIVFILVIEERENLRFVPGDDSGDGSAVIVVVVVVVVIVVHVVVALFQIESKTDRQTNVRTNGSRPQNETCGCVPVKEKDT